MGKTGKVENCGINRDNFNEIVINDVEDGAGNKNLPLK
jgi:hypothetical protein